MTIRRNLFLGLAASALPLLLLGAPLAGPTPDRPHRCPRERAVAGAGPTVSPDMMRMGGGSRTLFY